MRDTRNAKKATNGPGKGIPRRIAAIDGWGEVAAIGLKMAGVI
ncbi:MULTISPECIES: hypothetical protein [unclassified Mesorhizobium]|nr:MULTISPECIES: hypothetical protein [unclassified Mesorhizobium]ESZ55603.1 hypothetical protein X728_28915 [Mesorhizobium sp. L103C120A0]